MSIQAIIHEQGNGFPAVGGVVTTDGQQHYRVERYIGSTQTEQWRDNYRHAELEEIELEDVDGEVSDVRVELDEEQAS